MMGVGKNWVKPLQNTCTVRMHSNGALPTLNAKVGQRTHQTYFILRELKKLFYQIKLRKR